jgi:hypothetical protein
LLTLTVIPDFTLTVIPDFAQQSLESSRWLRLNPGFQKVSLRSILE